MDHRTLRRDPTSSGPGAVSRLRRLCQHPVLGPGAVVAGCVGVGAVIWAGDPTTPGGWLPTCPTKLLFGLVCPGCGAQRMLYSLMHGDLPAALGWNAVGVVAVLLLAWAFVAWCARLWTGRRIPHWDGHRWTATVVLVVVVAWFVVRNLPFAPFTALRV